MRVSRFAWTALVASVLVGTTSQALAENAIQRREDRANHDRWARSESQAAKPAKKKKASTDTDAAPAPSKSPRHHGELNGKLHLSAW